MSTSNTKSSTRRSKRIQSHVPKKTQEETKERVAPSLNICTTLRRLKQFNKLRYPIGPNDSLFLKERI